MFSNVQTETAWSSHGKIFSAQEVYGREKKGDLQIPGALCKKSAGGAHRSLCYTTNQLLKKVNISAHHKTMTVKWWSNMGSARMQRLS